jgi:hypothetical protein
MYLYGTFEDTTKEEVEATRSQDSGVYANPCTYLVQELNDDDDSFEMFI